MATKNAEASQKAQDVEMSVTRMMDRFENQMGEYTSFAYQIGTMASTSNGMFMGPGNVDFTIDCDVSVEDVNQIQAAGKRMRDVLRPALSKYDEEIRHLIKTLMEEQAELDEDLDKLGMAVEKQKSDAKNKALESEKELQKADAAKAVGAGKDTHGRLTDEFRHTSRNLKSCKTTSTNSIVQYRSREILTKGSSRLRLCSRQRGQSRFTFSCSPNGKRMSLMTLVSARCSVGPVYYNGI